MLVICWTGSLFSKGHGISAPTFQPKLCSIACSRLRTCYKVRCSGTWPCFLCFPLRTRYPPPTSITLASRSTDQVGPPDCASKGHSACSLLWPRCRRWTANPLGSRVGSVAQRATVSWERASWNQEWFWEDLPAMSGAIRVAKGHRKVDQLSLLRNSCPGSRNMVSAGRAAWTAVVTASEHT